MRTSFGCVFGSPTLKAQSVSQRVHIVFCLPHAATEKNAGGQSSSAAASTAYLFVPRDLEHRRNSSKSRNEEGGAPDDKSRWIKEAVDPPCCCDVNGCDTT